ncbi:nuclear nucleic acid-binding protein C1D [Drosophila innubila]|uniref:nuclear nucleic acid-binding protein C1D n=1 Tax=Drosophila innubila TaxID=198719 RepID=UPI00148E53BB|nr:nuclear nucleic acid-binding protein C1D [Drosophila innubila]
MAETQDSINRSQSSASFCEQMQNDQIFGVLQKFSANLDNLEKDLDCAVLAHGDPTLSTDEQIKLDTYLAYANSTLFWMYLRLNGSDLSKHYILHDLRRAKEMLAREKEINDSLAAPRLDIAASKRFIAAGMHTRFIDADEEKRPGSTK